MPKKTQTKKKEVGKSEKEKETKEQKSSTNLLNDLRKQQVRVLEQVNEGITSQQKVYGDIWNKWLGFSADTYKQMTKIATEEGKKYSGVYDLWNDYYEKLNAKMLNLSRKNMEEYLGVVDKWKEIAGVLEGLFSSTQWDAANAGMEELQKKYVEFSNHIAKKASESGDGAVSDYVEIQTSWLDFTEKMGKMMGEIGADDEMYKSIMERWESMFSQMTDEISKFVETSTEESKRSQEMWDEILSTSMNAMMKSAKPFLGRKEGA